MITPIEAHDRIREACLRRPDLRYQNWKEWKGFYTISEDRQKEEIERDLKIFKPFQGYCYIASYAFCHVIPEAVPYTKDRFHFWTMLDDEVWDLTKEQFNEPYNYTEGRKLARKSKPTLRIIELLKEAELYE